MQNPRRSFFPVGIYKYMANGESALRSVMDDERCVTGDGRSIGRLPLAPLEMSDF